MALVTNKKCILCQKSANVIVHYSPLDGKTEDPIPVCSEHYEMEDTIGKFIQIGADHIEVLN